MFGVEEQNSGKILFTGTRQNCQIYLAIQGEYNKRIIEISNAKSK